MKKLPRFVRLVGYLAVLLLLCYITARAVLAYEVHRASQLLRDLQTIGIGDSEASVEPIVHRYGGYQWRSTFANPADDPRAKEDYEYILEVNPWRLGLLTGHQRRFDSTIRAIAASFDSSFARAIGLRSWMVVGGISIRNKRVIAVGGTAILEGRAGWLAGDWRLLPKIADHRLEKFDSPDARKYSLSFSHLDAGTGWGEAWSAQLTPAATDNENLAGRHIDLRCLSSTSGCSTMCELMPEAARYAKDHPEQARLFGAWDEKLGTCRPPDAHENRFR